MQGNNHGLVTTPDEFIWYRADHYAVSIVLQLHDEGVAVSAHLAVEVHQRKNADLRGNSEHLPQCLVMKGFCKGIRIIKEEMGADRKIEAVIQKRQARESSGTITTLPPAPFIIGQE